ncbi:ABC transporter ATP-binding protein [Hoeflea sp.]|uniref:ABC transporter ATP-binding protein n=1 Tax=Hoeflea sp. TaxID=1940281 RepID=UPI003BAF8607
MSSQPKIAVHGVGKSYGGAIILEGVSLEVEAGSFCTVVGASGCGKSTFLRMLLSQEKPDRGAILLDGEPIPAEPTEDRGIVFQRYSVFPHLSVEDNLILADEFANAPKLGRVFGAKRKTMRSTVDKTLEAIGLASSRKSYPAQLSGGMQQRLAIAQALLKKPDVLLMDEPFGALDPGTRVDMHALLLDLWRERGMTVFMVTHDIHEAFKLGTRVLVFDKRRHDPHAPQRYGATITYDLPLDRRKASSVPDARDLITQPTDTRPGDNDA